MAKKANKKRADGRIAVQVYLGRDKEGKRKYKTVYGASQKEADLKADALKLSIHKKLDVASQKDLFRLWAEIFHKMKSLEVGRSQAAVYDSIIRHLNGYMGDIPLVDIKTYHIQEIINELARKNPNTEKPASKNFLLMIRSTASQIFKTAIESRVVEYNPASAARIPKVAKAETRRALFEHEIKWIEETEHRAKRAAMIMLYAGLRRGEVIPLTWEDVDLKNNVISVNKSVEANGNVYIVKKTTKTESGIREIDIPKKLSNYLKSEIKVSKNNLVCANISGKIHTPTTWKSMWESYLCDLNIKYGDFSKLKKQPRSKLDPNGVPLVIPKITAHWLRHTYATMLYFAGIDILTAKEQLGHADFKTTLQIYTHLDKRHKRKSMNKLDVYLESASQMQVVNDETH